MSLSWMRYLSQVNNACQRAGQGFYVEHTFSEPPHELALQIVINGIFQLTASGAECGRGEGASKDDSVVNATLVALETLLKQHPSFESYESAPDGSRFGTPEVASDYRMHGKNGTPPEESHDVLTSVEENTYYTPSSPSSKDDAENNQPEHKPASKETHGEVLEMHGKHEETSDTVLFRPIVQSRITVPIRTEQNFHLSRITEFFEKCYIEQI
ncbi:hypothetical protein BDQ17DRAFT_230386 [Cyathus striatus]|nr:hypothetical protein BDQ17DRAFT_230386 [Cyathus striatus]